MADPNQWTVSQLKDILRDKGQVTTGNKAELLARLLQANPDGSWSQDYAAFLEAEKERIALALRQSGEQNQGSGNGDTTQTTTRETGEGSGTQVQSEREQAEVREKRLQAELEALRKEVSVIRASQANPGNIWPVTGIPTGMNIPGYGMVYAGSNTQGPAGFGCYAPNPVPLQQGESSFLAGNFPRPDNAHLGSNRPVSAGVGVVNSTQAGAGTGQVDANLQAAGRTGGMTPVAAATVVGGGQQVLGSPGGMAGSTTAGQAGSSGGASTVTTETMTGVPANNVVTGTVAMQALQPVAGTGAYSGTTAGGMQAAGLGQAGMSGAAQVGAAPEQGIQVTAPENVVGPRINITAVAEMLNQFDGNSEQCENWVKRLNFLKASFNLNDGMAKVLLTMRLKGRAAEWIYSKPEYVNLTFDNVVKELKAMFGHRLSKMTVKNKFEKRVWLASETFPEYVHEKVILANAVPINDQEELLEYIIEGIPDPMLRNQAYVQRFTSLETLIEAFQKVTIKTKTVAAVHVAAKGSEQQRSGGQQQQRKGGEQQRSGGEQQHSGEQQRQSGDRRSKKCYQCGSEEHIKANCPKRKCFKCGATGHKAYQCAESEKDKTSAVVDVQAVLEVWKDKYAELVWMDGRQVEALIDTGSDINLLRRSEYVRMGSPDYIGKKLCYRGVGGQISQTLGELEIEFRLRDHDHIVRAHVVPDVAIKGGLVLGLEFLETTRMTTEGRKIISIKPRSAKKKHEWDVTAEVCTVDVEKIVEGNDDITVLCKRDEGVTETLERMIEEYNPTGTKEVGVKMKIVMKSDKPIYHTARRLSAYELNVVHKQIDEWLESGIIRPSTSEYASPIVLVKKKDGKYRLCVDYRDLNKEVVRDRFPLPLIDDVLDSLQGAKVFSKMDLENGFFHVPVEEGSKKYTAFVVPDGEWEFEFVPFGFCNSPAVFQRHINAVFRDLIREGVVQVYVDDLIVPSVDVQSGIEKLKRVFAVAQEAGLRFKWSKCKFLCKRIEFLGTVVEDGKIEPSPAKVAAVRNFPEPHNLVKVQSFLGLTGHFRRFIPNYSNIARPLTDLLRGVKPFAFGREQREAVDLLKEKLVGAPILTLYRVGADTELHTDASKYGYGAILLQKDNEDGKLHPVHYFSRKTTREEEKYHSYELEVLAVMRAIERFRVYLIGIEFKIVTDCKAFTQTLNKRELCPKIARWAMELQEYKFTIEHRSGKGMCHVDALSRNPIAEVMALDKEQDGLLPRLKKAQRDDPDVLKLIEEVREGNGAGYCMQGGLLFKEDTDDIKMVVPKGMQTELVRRMHEQGHFGPEKVETLVRKEYWIPKLREKVEKVARNCVKCILAEKKQGRPEGYLAPIEKGLVPLDTYHIDHLGPLSSTAKSYKHLFVVIDAFSKFVWLYATRSIGTAEAVDKLKKQALVFGNPRRIISDHGPGFTSNDFESYCEEAGVEHVLSTTGVPRGNGQVERVNRTVIPLLTKLAASKPEEWYKYLGIAQLQLNAIVHRSLGVAPFKVMFGVQPRLQESVEILEAIREEMLREFQEERDEIREMAAGQIAKVQEENRRSFNKKRKESTKYQRGELVAIRRTQSGPGLKLRFKFLGPYLITKVLGNDRYEVEKVGNCEGTRHTLTAADSMKYWVDAEDPSLDEENESENESEKESEK